MLCAKSSRVITDVGIDYITATARTQSGRLSFNRIGVTELWKERKAGNDESSFRLHDLEGIRCGSVEYATSPNYDMLRMSAHLAASRYKEIIANASNVSRLDLQVTVRLTPPNDNLAEHAERQLRKFKLKHNRQYQIELRRNDVKGKTLYLGSRKSERYARLYDKGKESKLPELAGCWRMEVQHNDDLARHMAGELLRSGDHVGFVIGQVASYYQSRGGVILPSPLAARLQCSARARREYDTNSYRRLQWLRSQVRGVVEKELARGNRDAVLDALGLSIMPEGSPDDLN